MARELLEFAEKLPRRATQNWSEELPGRPRIGPGAALELVWETLKTTKIGPGVSSAQGFLKAFWKPFSGPGEALGGPRRP